MSDAEREIGHKLQAFLAAGGTASYEAHVALNEVIAAIRADARSKALEEENARPQWRCFHCDEVFTSFECAKEHFGSSEGCDPGCVEKLKGGEHGLLRRVRELEEQLIPYLHETSAVETYVHSLKADHAAALRREEERGYNKGVRDMRAEVETAEARLAAARAEGRGWLLIETAPKDGRTFLACSMGPSPSYFAGWRPGGYAEPPETTLWCSDGDCWRAIQRPHDEWTPTHWRPLPASPEPDAEERG